MLSSTWRNLSKTLNPKRAIIVLKRKTIKTFRRLIIVQINDTMTEFQVGVIETEERKETLYSQTPLYRGEAGGGGRIKNFWGAPLRNGVTEW